jgi:hypothetical protein
VYLLAPTAQSVEAIGVFSWGDQRQQGNLVTAPGQVLDQIVGPHVDKRRQVRTDKKYAQWFHNNRPLSVKVIMGSCLAQKMTTDREIHDKNRSSSSISSSEVLF